MLERLRQWVVDRFGLGPIHDKMIERRVASGAWYFGDGAALFLLLIVQVVTGGMMALEYSAAPDTAYQSVVHITSELRLGWFVRALHYWSAGLMVVVLVIHLFRQILVGGYKEPREGTWYVGVVLFFLVIMLSFTGYVLRWDERGLYALRVALNMFYKVPVIGEHLVMLVQGGPELNTGSLTRIFTVHVVLLPLLLLALAGYHMYLVILHGVTSPTEQKRPVHSAEQQKEVYERDAQSRERGEWFFPMTAAKSGAMAAVVFAVAVTLALVLGPRKLDPQANLVNVSMPAEEWWFAWYSALIALLPPWAAPWFIVLFPLVLLAVLVLLPLVDRGPYRGIRHRPVAVGCILLCVVALLYLTDLRRRSPWTGWPNAAPPAPPRGVVLTEEAARGRTLFAAYGCNSCHAVSGVGPRVGPDLARLERRWSLAELRAYVLNPPAEVAMPAYAGRISDEDLELVAGYVLVAQTWPRE